MTTKEFFVVCLFVCLKGLLFFYMGEEEIIRIVS